MTELLEFDFLPSRW